VGQPTPLVHVGYHKTASSWLQSRLWSDSRLGFRLCPRDLVGRLLIEPHPLAFDGDAFRARIEPWLEETGRRGLVPVLSHERLSGYPHSGGFDSREIADRIAAVAPGARILAVVREQRSAIVSNYHQYVRDGGASPLARYLDPPQAGHRRVPGFAVEFFQYDRLIDVYRERFGEANVCVLIYEELQNQPERFLGRIEGFVGSPAAHGGLRATLSEEIVNPAPSPAAIALLRWATLLFRASPLHPSPPLPSRVAYGVAARVARRLGSLSPRALTDRRAARERAVVDDRVRGLYDDTNARLSELAEVDVGGYGYAVRPTP
jgi:hypothetical protein